MKALRWITGIVIVLAAAFALFLMYMGMFSKITVSELEMGPYVYAYEEFTGPYYKTMPVFERVNAALTAEGIKPEKGFGVYFDNPASVPADKLRSHCGSIIEEKDAAKIPVLAQKLKIGNFVRGNCVVAEFPLKNALSFMMGPMKVYPAIAKHMQDRGYKARESYEFYDMPAKTIYFMIPIEK